MVHYYDGVTQTEANIDLPLLVLVLVEPSELLKFGINMRWDCDRHRLISWPVGRLQALEGAFKVVVFRRVWLQTLQVRVELFDLLLDDGEVREHALEFAHLVHSARNFQIGDEHFLEINVLRLF